MCYVGDDDWNDVVRQCCSFAAKWEVISAYLGLSSGLIDVIKTNNPKDCNACLNDALKHWIRQNYNTKKFGEPSWRTLIDAIAMVDNKLAWRLSSCHQCTRKLIKLYDYCCSVCLISHMLTTQ